MEIDTCVYIYNRWYWQKVLLCKQLWSSPRLGISPKFCLYFLNTRKRVWLFFYNFCILVKLVSISSFGMKLRQSQDLHLYDLFQIWYLIVICWLSFKTSVKSWKSIRRFTNENMNLSQVEIFSNFNLFCRIRPKRN